MLHNPQPFFNAYFPTTIPKKIKHRFQKNMGEEHDTIASHKSHQSITPRQGTFHPQVNTKMPSIMLLKRNAGHDHDQS